VIRQVIAEIIDDEVVFLEEIRVDVLGVGERNRRYGNGTRLRGGGMPDMDGGHCGKLSHDGGADASDGALAREGREPG
jgi:hypothetical protein